MGPRTLERIWQAARPLLTIYGEQGRTLGISTPADGDDFYGRLFTEAQAAGLPGAVAFRATTQELNPAVSETFLEQERLLLGEGAFRREYLAEFSPGGGGAFLEEDAVAAVIGRYHELRPEQGTGWLIGLDVAFSSDPSAAVVVGRDPENRKRLVVGHAERWLPKRSRKQRRRAKTERERLDVAASVLDGVGKLSQRFGNCPVVTDQHARMLVESGLKERGVPRVIHRTWSPSSQTEAFRLLRARIYGDAISLPINDQLQRELCRVRERSRAGPVSDRSAALGRWPLRPCVGALARRLGARAPRHSAPGANLEQLQERWPGASPLREGDPGSRHAARSEPGEHVNRRRAIEQSRFRADRARSSRWVARERLREEKAKRRALAQALRLTTKEEDDGTTQAAQR